MTKKKPNQTESFDDFITSTQTMTYIHARMIKAILIAMLEELEKILEDAEDDGNEEVLSECFRIEKKLTEIGFEFLSAVSKPHWTTK